MNLKQTLERLQQRFPDMIPENLHRGDKELTAAGMTLFNREFGRSVNNILDPKFQYLTIPMTKEMLGSGLEEDFRDYLDQEKHVSMYCVLANGSGYSSTYRTIYLWGDVVEVNILLEQSQIIEMLMNLYKTWKLEKELKNG